LPLNTYPENFPPLIFNPHPLQVPVEVSPQLLQELLAMGFGEARAARALHFSGNSALDGAISWLEEHEGDADLDEPLLVPKV
jgi:uncharacterized UBP type Zn finger protein